MNNLNQETTPGARNREMPGQSGNDGEGPPPEWGRSDFEARPLKNPSDYLVRHIKRIANSQHIFGFLLSFL